MPSDQDVRCTRLARRHAVAEDRAIGSLEDLVDGDGDMVRIDVAVVGTYVADLVPRSLDIIDCIGEIHDRCLGHIGAAEDAHSGHAARLVAVLGVGDDLILVPSRLVDVLIGPGVFLAWFAKFRIGIANPHHRLAVALDDEVADA